MRALRDVLPQEALDQAAAAATAHFTLFAKAHPSIRSIACYLSHGSELPTGPILEVCRHQRWCVAVPVWDGHAYHFAWLESDAPLESGPMGIPQPANSVFSKSSEIDLFLVPGLAFSTDGGRIGYGGGWYDRLLSGRRADSLCVGLGLDFQLVSEPLPLEPHDMRMEAVLTPQRLCSCIVPPDCVPFSIKGVQP